MYALATSSLVAPIMCPTLAPLVNGTTSSGLSFLGTSDHLKVVVASSKKNSTDACPVFGVYIYETHEVHDIVVVLVMLVHVVRHVGVF
jgi:hypothetical protein